MREIRVAYAGPDGIDEAIAASTRKIIGEGYNLRFYSTVYAQELLETAQNYDVHIFVLFLNSIAFPSGNSPAERRLEQALRLVIHLKARYRGALMDCGSSGRVSFKNPSPSILPTSSLGGFQANNSAHKRDKIESFQGAERKYNPGHAPELPLGEPLKESSCTRYIS
jgi:hypothetical protein